MPELAEVALMAVEVNRHSHHIFHAVSRSSIAKLGSDLPLPRCWRTFRLEARSRGKEMRLDVWPVHIDAKLRKQEEKERQQNAENEAEAEQQQEGKEDGEEEEEEVKATPQRKRKRKQPSLNSQGKPFTRVHPSNPTIPLDGPLPLLFRMGMTGHIQAFSSHTATHKHAHLTFLSSEPTDVSVCFIDQRQFGRWLVTDEWDSTRGPCPLTQYTLFRQHVLASLDKRAMDRPLCEVLLDQRYFNGIGNYLRAEICYRADVNPFASAHNVLSRLAGVADSEEEGEADVLRLCHDVPQEVYSLGYRYGSMNNEEAVRQQREAEEKAAAQSTTTATVPPTQLSRKSFSQWLRCYEKHADGMLSTVDGLGRAMWHSSRWRVAGKTKAGSRRPKKGKTISGADREVDDSTAAQGESAEETEEVSSGSEKRKIQSKKQSMLTRVVRGVRDDEVDESKEAAVDNRARGRKRSRVVKVEPDSASEVQKKRGRSRLAAAVDDGGNESIEQEAEHTGRRRSSRLTAIKAQQEEEVGEHAVKREEGIEGKEDGSTAGEEKENRAAKKVVSQKRTRKTAPTRRAG